MAGSIIAAFNPGMRQPKNAIAERHAVTAMKVGRTVGSTP